MSLLQLDLLRRQTEQAVRQEIRKKTAPLRRELSLTRQASRMAGMGEEILDGGLRQARRWWSGRENGFWEDGLEPLEMPEQPVVLPDGYVRRTPVQPYRTLAGYRRQRMRRRLAVLALVIFLAALAAAIWRSGLLRF